jgi:hypothetical protein
VKGTYHAKDILTSSQDALGGNDVISSGGGRDIIIGGIGDDIIASFGDVRYGELDADLVFGDNAKVVLSEQNGDGEDDVVEAFSTGFSLENVFEGLTFNDIIVTGNGI